MALLSALQDVQRKTGWRVPQLLRQSPKAALRIVKNADD